MRSGENKESEMHFVPEREHSPRSAESLCLGGYARTCQGSAPPQTHVQAQPALSPGTQTVMLLLPVGSLPNAQCRRPPQDSGWFPGTALTTSSPERFRWFVMKFLPLSI